MTQAYQTPEQQKWATKLLGFHYEIFYKPGKDNRVADALSRCHSNDQPVLLAAVASSMPTILTTLQSYYKTAEGQQMVTDLSQQHHYTVNHSLLHYRGRLFLPDIEDLRSL